MVNKAIIIGNLGKDPEVKSTQAGKKVASFSVATSERWKDREGRVQERTTWHRVVVFNEGLAKVAEQYLQKGARVYIEGRIANRDYEDREGVKKSISEIVLDGFNCTMQILGGGMGREGSGDDYGGGGGGGDRGYGGGRGGGSSPGRSSGGGRPGGGGTSRRDDFIDDEIPF